MRQIGIFLLIVIALIAIAGPAAAQPKVSIVGLVDNITSYTHNLSQTDLNPARNKDLEWYSRVRVRPDIIAEVGTTKFVLGLEIDETWGQTGTAAAIGDCGNTATGAQLIAPGSLDISTTTTHVAPPKHKPSS